MMDRESIVKEYHNLRLQRTEEEVYILVCEMWADTKRTLAEATKALVKYGYHERSCKPPCSCGLSQIVEDLANNPPHVFGELDNTNCPPWTARARLKRHVSKKK